MLRLLAGEAARRFGGRAAVVTGATTLTFAALDRLSDQVASGFAHRGVRIGDVVALALPDGPEFVVCYVAAAKIGAVTAGVGVARPELLFPLDPALVVTVPGVLPRTAGLDVVTLRNDHGDNHGEDHGDPGEHGVRLPGGLLRAERPPPPFPPDPGRPVVITFTAGRTGPPKAVLFGARQLEAIRAHGAGGRWGTGDARLVPHPLGQLGFATRLPAFLQTGRTCHVLPRWSAEAALRVLRAHDIRVLQGEPGQLAELLARDADLPALRLVLSSGAPAPPELVAALRARYGVPVCNRYVCTEAGLGLGTRPDDPPGDAEVSVGRPRAGVDVSIRDPGGRAVAEGEPGEVFLRSAAVMSGYVGRNTDQAVFARDGFVHTGDRGYIDHTGRLHLVGRVPRAPGS
ncbi:long-chain fatty acid--CoA ligase [Actinomadura sp. ATCC 31491]|uniref:Long-chain fatty acid--CoA ligase n=1 Tax=Actinomadura luzonensis TaxID=2805427 RepID=A0ABT0G546_9ACTN|nr:class I adenylate-forming enzyme family protein [Actinomadura luzonensis]MCK2219629.1 long-chain fatty acid--CoA ligase [Actinomadura luzonensis]